MLYVYKNLWSAVLGKVSNVYENGELSYSHGVTSASLFPMLDRERIRPFSGEVVHLPAGVRSRLYEVVRKLLELGERKVSSMLRLKEIEFYGEVVYIDIDKIGVYLKDDGSIYCILNCIDFSKERKDRIRKTFIFDFGEDVGEFGPLLRHSGAQASFVRFTKGEEFQLRRLLDDERVEIIRLLQEMAYCMCGILVWDSFSLPPWGLIEKRGERYFVGYYFLGKLVSDQAKYVAGVVRSYRICHPESLMANYGVDLYWRPDADEYFLGAGISI